MFCSLLSLHTSAALDISLKEAMNPVCGHPYYYPTLAECFYTALVAEVLFTELNADVYFLEFDDSRSGSFEPLRFLPKGRIVVLGLVSSKKATLESKESIVKRIHEAAKIVPLDQLALSPQCGFGTPYNNICPCDIKITQVTLSFCHFQLRLLMVIF